MLICLPSLYVGMYTIRHTIYRSTATRHFDPVDRWHFAEISQSFRCSRIMNNFLSKASLIDWLHRRLKWEWNTTGVTEPWARQFYRFLFLSSRYTPYSGDIIIALRIISHRFRKTTFSCFFINLKYFYNKFLCFKTKHQKQGQRTQYIWYFCNIHNTSNLFIAFLKWNLCLLL